MFGPATALAREEFSVEVAAGASASTNPFLVAGSNTEAASASLEITPLLTMEDEVSNVALRGFARIEQYSRSYSRDEAAALELTVSRQQSDRLKLRGGATVQTNRSSAQDILTDRAISLQPLPGLNPQLDDVSFIGRRTRTFSASANVGASYSLNSISAIDGDLSAGVFKYKDPQLADYRHANQEIGYSRLVAERSWVQASVRFGQIDYLGRKPGDATIVSPLVGLTKQLSATLRVSAAAGVSLSRVRQADGSHASGTGLALRGSLCEDEVRGRVCVNLDRSSQPTALGDISTLTSIGASANRRLNRRDTLQLNSNFSRSSERGNLTNGRATFAGASAELSRKIDPRFTVFGTASFSDIYNSGAPRSANLQARIGLRYRFGALR